MYIYIQRYKYAAPDIFLKILNMFVLYLKCVCVYIYIHTQCVYTNTVLLKKFDIIWQRNTLSQTTQCPAHTIHARITYF